MKRALWISTILFLVVSFAVVQSVLAKESQQSTTWSAAIAYFNPYIPVADPPVTSGEMSIVYYPEVNPTPTVSPPLTINEHQSGVVLVGSSASFKGAVVLSSSIPLLAVYRQAPTSGDPYSPVLTTAFSLNQAGAGTFYIPYVVYDAIYDSQIGVQNLESSATTATLEFYGSGCNPCSYTTPQIGAQASKVIKLSETGVVSEGFSGSVRITTPSSQRIVASVQNIIRSNSRLAHSYEGTAAGATTVSVPTAMCTSGPYSMVTTLHIQNLSGTQINSGQLYIDYYDGAGALVTTYTSTNAIPGYNKLSLSACIGGSSVQGKDLAVRIRAPQNIAVVGVINSIQLASAFTFSSTAGTAKVALPYVEWSPSQWNYQSTIYLMNTGNGTATITATYYWRDGTPVTQTLTVPQYAILETNPSLVPGLLSVSNDYFKGAVTFDSNQPILVLVNIIRSYNNPSGIVTLGDSYSGIPYTP